ncbi:hypothetical protein CHGG_07128 [Chaetomium globosum CBS 148.51]|uniref:CN hydrolase domain-containing protein n=1 Tax=Chaetomium globosum (strain ATCC 6205 / CBS 148.51 / DSM 1962 / NBRC 6347 / NRRL 1970) TaxID=306901 RepID=Q2GY26_CHAGB|nr:uncharacterized protein CHGG_07128 [Chaetomium globosum CBS 148.51]EAQ85875.1 hypothetical protein CHGG_07128 [Chaetomium globosum CBS 148.51]
MASSSSTTHPPVLKQPVKLACVQLASGSDKAANLAHAAVKVREAAQTGAKIVVLPECFNSPYGCDYFPSYAETLLPSPPTPAQSPSYHALSTMARENAIYLIGGSIPELATSASEPSQNTYYNTSLTFSPSGALLATHRKIHLFDIDIPGGDHLPRIRRALPRQPADHGRPARLATIAARRGCFALVYPGAFNLTTGPLHWELLARARAVDNQLLVADPMAKVLAEAGEGEGIVVVELDGERIELARRGIPLRDQRRFDVYPDVSRVQ